MRDIHLLRQPARPELAWWRVIGPETRTDILWRAELRVCSVYALSSLSFSAVGLVALAGGRVSIVEGLLLIFVGVTSFQADVTFLGIDHMWRTLDTLLALGLVLFYVIQAIIERSAASLLAFVPLGWAIRSFVKSQASVTFKQRAYHHINWHFGVQIALLMLLFSGLIAQVAGSIGLAFPQ